jgi:hypothetical protein
MPIDVNDHTPTVNVDGLTIRLFDMWTGSEDLVGIALYGHWPTDIVVAAVRTYLETGDQIGFDDIDGDADEVFQDAERKLSRSYGRWSDAPSDEDSVWETSDWPAAGFEPVTMYGL